MRLIELFLNESSEEDRAIISLAAAIANKMNEYEYDDHEFDLDDDPDYESDFEPNFSSSDRIDLGKIGDIFNTPLEELNSVELVLQSEESFLNTARSLGLVAKDDRLARAPGGVWNATKKSITINKDILGRASLKSSIAHELRHALDDFKSGFEANKIDGRYSKPKHKSHRTAPQPGKPDMPYLAQPAEINARFVEVLHSLVPQIDRLAKSSLSMTQARDKMHKILVYQLEMHNIAHIFKTKEKSPDYKRLLKRGADFIDKELVHLRDTKQMTEATKRPYHTVLPDEKRYAVYDQNDKEVASFEFPAIWNSSPALKLAQAKVAELTRAQMSVDSENRAAADEARPLSQDERTYATVTLLFQNLMVPTKGMSASAKDTYFKEYGEELSAMSAKLDKLHKKGGIRDSVLMGKRNS